MHGEVISFYVESDGGHVVITATNPDEGNHVTIRVPQSWLATMAEAEPRMNDGPRQTATPHYEN